MGNTLFMYHDELTKSAAVVASVVLSMSACKAVHTAADTRKYGRLICVAGPAAVYEAYRDIVQAFASAGKEIGFFFVNMEPDRKDIFLQAAGESCTPAFSADLDGRTLTDDAVHAAENILAKDGRPENRNEARLLEVLGEFLRSHDTGILATGHDNIIRSTPIEYVWHKGRFYFFSEGGRKFAHLWRNRRASYSVCEPYGGGVQTLAGLQANGTVRVYEPDDAVYEEVRKVKGISDNTLRTMPVTLHLIELTPAELIFMWGPFLKEDLPVKQIYDGDMEKIKGKA